MFKVVLLVLLLSSLSNGVNKNYTCYAPPLESDAFCYGDTPITTSGKVAYSIGGVEAPNTVLCCRIVGCYQGHDNQCDYWGVVPLLEQTFANPCYTVGTSLAPFGLADWYGVTATPGISCYVNGTGSFPGTKFHWTV